MLESILKYNFFTADRTNFWIGLFQASEDNWIWISDNSPLTLQSYQNWYSGKASMTVNISKKVYYKIHVFIT